LIIKDEFAPVSKVSLRDSGEKNIAAASLYPLSSQGKSRTSRGIPNVGAPLRMTASPAAARSTVSLFEPRKDSTKEESVSLDKKNRSFIKTEEFEADVAEAAEAVTIAAIFWFRSKKKAAACRERAGEFPAAERVSSNTRELDRIALRALSASAADRLFMLRLLSSAVILTSLETITDTKTVIRDREKRRSMEIMAISFKPMG
jgi:hypothetical protein